MKLLTFNTLLLLLVLVTVVACNDGSTSRAVDGAVIQIEAPWVRPAMAMEGEMAADSATVSAGYMVIRNSGPQEDRLLSVSSPAAATIELHESMMDSHHAMQMHPIEGGIVVPARGSVELKPGGMHLMLIGLTDDLEAGETVPLTLTFERAGPIEVSATVNEP